MDALTWRGARLAARIDRHVGERIRKRRTMLGYTQEQLAAALEISYQQVQKYETGANRVSAGRLYQIAQRLEASVAYFFEGLDQFETPAASDMAHGSNRATIELVKNFTGIADSSIRAAVTGLVKALSERAVEPHAGDIISQIDAHGAAARAEAQADNAAARASGRHMDSGSGNGNGSGNGSGDDHVD